MATACRPPRSPGWPRGRPRRPRSVSVRSKMLTTCMSGVDGIHLKVCLERGKVCLLVMIGMRADGRKELIALIDGHREDAESWADLLRDCKRGGMRAPALAVGDGALGFWKAVRDVFPTPKSSVAGGTRSRMFLPHCRSRRTRARRKHRRSSTRRAACVLRLPGRASDASAHDNPIESTFATVRLRTQVTKGAGSRAAGVAVAFKLIDSVHAGWRAVNAHTWSLSSAPEPTSKTTRSSNGPINQ
jgi:putative transposase